MTTVPHPRLHRLASAWVVEHDENGRQTHAMGPSIWEAGVNIYTASDPHHGPQAYDADGNVIPAGHLLGYACRLLRIHDALRTAQRQHELASRPEAQA
ncbi:UNVERIFIED_CONTAM: hypothetical protein RF649_02125 [Kocuria sp. CPCC 205295]|uniref:hypothetical protein n=1 Tax=unclassified Kocuria TaxID=2649579 RepID=UPI0034D51CE4